MIFYKLKKVFRENGKEMAKMAFGLSFLLCSFVPLFLIPVLADDNDRKERIQMGIAFIVTAAINILSLFYVDSHFSYNILAKIGISTLICFLFYLPFLSALAILGAYQDCKLNKDEIRDAKLSGLIKNKLFK